MSKMPKDDQVYLLTDTKTSDAVLRNLQTLAESTQRLSEARKAAHPQIEWRAIAAFRNILAHDYLGINLEWVWETIVQDLPLLEQHITAMLRPAAEPPTP